MTEDKAAELEQWAEKLEKANPVMAERVRQILEELDSRTAARAPEPASPEVSRAREALFLWCQRRIYQSIAQVGDSMFHPEMVAFLAGTALAEYCAYYHVDVAVIAQVVKSHAEKLRVSP